MTATVTAIYAYRYEPDWMIEQLRENLAWMDDFIEYDTRNADTMWVPVEERTSYLLNEAKRRGAEWVYYTAPDERLEQDAERKIRRVINRGSTSTSYTMRLREMYTPDSYRIDGIWGRKRRCRLYHITDRARPLQMRRLDLNLYHLKMIEPANRELRAEVFRQANTWDNKTLGFDYLTDETGLQLETIPAGREYSPEYQRYDFRVSGHTS